MLVIFYHTNYGNLEPNLAQSFYGLIQLSLAAIYHNQVWHRPFGVVEQELAGEGDGLGLGRGLFDGFGHLFMALASMIASKRLTAHMPMDAPEMNVTITQSARSPA